jgi:hypothetical protein
LSAGEKKRFEKRGRFQQQEEDLDLGKDRRFAVGEGGFDFGKGLERRHFWNTPPF